MHVPGTRGVAALGADVPAVRMLDHRTEFPAECTEWAADRLLHKNASCQVGLTWLYRLEVARLPGAEVWGDYSRGHRVVYGPIGLGPPAQIRKPRVWLRGFFVFTGFWKPEQIPDKRNPCYDPANFPEPVSDSFRVADDRGQRKPDSNRVAQYCSRGL